MNFNKFVDYLWFLAHIPFKISSKSKNKSDVFKLFDAGGKVLDKLKQDILLLRRQAMIGTAQGKALDGHGNDRKMTRYVSENDEQYRRRLRAKRETAEKAGTLYGIKLVLESLGYEDVDIEPLYLHDADRWAEFYVLINEDNVDAIKDFEIIKRTVRDVKQASSLPNYGFRMAVISHERFETTLINRISIDFFRNRLLVVLDGSWLLDGSVFLGELEETLDLHNAIIKNRITIKNNEILQSMVRIEKNLWYLDGAYLLDGHKELNAELIEEVL